MKELTAFLLACIVAMLIGMAFALAAIGAAPF